jgi:flagellar hook-associated protein 1 FlgK
MLAVPQAESAMVDREALRMELTNRRSEVQGVNLDEEMAQMIIFQNAYNAAARLIQTTQEMYDVLTAM